MEQLLNTVKLNCNISDAKYWGHFSVCGLLMRMRELYRSETGLKPWDPIPKESIMQWIAEKESLWKSLENREFETLIIEDFLFSPFDIPEINLHLNNRGYVYGAGYGLYMKPTFFIADMVERREISDYTVYICGKEHVRDLFSSAAMLQGGCIFIRLEPLKTLLWEKFLNLRTKEAPDIKRVFQRYGIDPDSHPDEEFEKRLNELAARYSEMLLYHEIAESVEDVPEWTELLLSIKERRIELILRALKDHLADSSDYGPIKRAIERGESELLNLYIDFMEGYRLVIYPQFIDSVKSGDPEKIETLRQETYRRFLSLRDRIIELYRDKNIEEIRTLLKKELTGL
ncbi:MAG: hypothetical protein N2257_09715 [Thermodesulfovibrionales bacterium]|nr:hypothetical protein [Thermodesulfovibrionales bacterium]